MISLLVAFFLLSLIVSFLCSLWEAVLLSITPSYAEVNEDLGIRTVEGDMVDLGAFDDAAFDLVVHPVSNVFSSRVRPVWHEAFRVLRPGGQLLAGFMNPAIYLFDEAHAEATGELHVRHALPYSDLADLSPQELAKRRSIIHQFPT